MTITEAKALTDEELRIKVAEKKRFYAKIDTTGTCWEWHGSMAPNGYGQFYREKGKSRQAHRIAWEYENGEIPQGLYVCHKCDNRKCCRPDHLFLGTHSDNMRDMVSKNRHNTVPGCFAMLKVRNCSGSRNPQAKLSEEDAELIKSIPKVYGRGAKVARHFGVHEEIVSGIWRGKRWKHIKPSQDSIQKAKAFLLTMEGEK